MIKYVRYALQVGSRIARAVRSEVDRVRFELREPGMRRYCRDHVLPLATELRKPLCRYMIDCTKDDSPITMGQACFMLRYVRAVKPRRILDLGSGFTSYIFAYYASGLPDGERPAIYAIDHSAHWLEQTRKFLEAEKMREGPEPRLQTWDEFAATTPEPFDFVSVDIGTLEFRCGVIDRILHENLAPGGRGLLDDMHFPEYRRAALRSARAARCTPVCLQTVCEDEYQKVAFVVYKRS